MSAYNGPTNALRQEFDAGFFRRRYARLGLPEGDDEALFRFYVVNVNRYALDPHPGFSETAYLDANLDVRDAVAAGRYNCGFQHWIGFGRAEGRSWAGAPVRQPGRKSAEAPARDREAEARLLFSAEAYRTRYGFSAGLSDQALLTRFLDFGLANGEIPCAPAEFDEDFYTTYYGDVGKAFAAGDLPSGFYHYVSTGKAEGRSPTYAMGHLLERKLGRGADPSAIAGASALEERLRPLPHRMDTSRAPVFNIFVPSLDPDIMFGGYIAFLHFVCRLVERGRVIRFIVLEDDYSSRAWFMRGIAKRPRWVQAFRHADFVNATTKAAALPVHPADICISYSTWTTHDAWSVAQHLDRKRVVFFIQEFEPVFYEHGSHHFLTQSAYHVPHDAIFNSPFLASYFEEARLGVFAAGQGRHTIFKHALAHVAPDPALAARTGPRRLIFYARPERHATRNLFEIGILALRAAVQAGVFPGEWTFFGIGSLGKDYTVHLHDGHAMTIVSRIDQSQYEQLLQSFDIGLSLMWAPHPSVMPFELARAGVVTVTNTFSNRDAALLAGFGDNIVPAPPTIDGIVGGLREAVRRAGHHETRIAAASLDWPTNWDDVFDAPFFAEFDTFFHQHRLSGGEDAA